MMLTELASGVPDKIHSRVATNGMYQFAISLNCDVDEYFEATQEIISWPFEMNSDYFKNVKPRARLRSWFTPVSSSSAQ